VALRGGAARRYAAAVFDLAKQNNTLDRWLSDLKTLNGIFGSERAVQAMEDPKATEVDKEAAVSRLVPPDVVQPLAMNLLLLLIRRERLALLPRITQVFQQMYNKEKGIVVADVTTAVPLDEAHKQHLSQQLAEITGGKQVELTLHEDPRILGGLIARVGDELLDASVATRLATLAERLT
jgi:F-type H+-transporting ATPase subunit delta